MDSKVYIVDDDHDVRSSIAFMLMTQGVSTRTFASGSDFIGELDDLDPACILLDLRMPGLDGVEVLRELATRRVTWPAIIMTGHGEVALAVQTMKMGAIDFIEKPFSEERLQACLKKGFDMLVDPFAGMEILRPQAILAASAVAVPSAA